MKKTWSLGLVAALALTCAPGCVEVLVFEDEGELSAFSEIPESEIGGGLCDDPNNMPHFFAEDAPLSVSIAIGCLDDFEVRESRCDVTLEGSIVQARSFIKIRNWQDGDSDCPWHFVSCESPPLPAGEYTFVFGPHEQTFSVPSEDPAICASVRP